MKEDILKLRNEGKTYNEISKILGCSKSTVSYHCSKNIIKIKDINEKDIIEILKLRKEENLTYLKIWEKLNKKITKENIRIICNKNGLSYLNRPNKEQIDEIRKAYSEIKNYKKVAKILGIAYETVRKYVNILELTEEERSIRKSKYVVDWRVRTKQKLIDYKGGECSECGYKKCIAALEFHHLDPNEKDFTISGKSWSFERLKKEVDKCILVCNRCHTEIHYLEKG